MTDVIFSPTFSPHLNTAIATDLVTYYPTVHFIASKTQEAKLQMIKNVGI